MRAAAGGETPATATSSAPEGEFSGLLGKAKDGLSSNSRSFQKKSESVDVVPVVEAPAKSEGELKWEEIEKSMKRALKIKELDFTDLQDVDDIDYIEVQVRQCIDYINVQVENIKSSEV